MRDRLRSWFKGESRRPVPGPSSGPPTGAAAKDLEQFISSRRGIEAYLEPKTAIYSTTILLVAGDGEYLRRPVKDRGQADALCRKHGLPLYDAGIVGYPKRMREYEKGVRRDEVSLDDLPPWPTDDGNAE